MVKSGNGKGTEQSPRKSIRKPAKKGVPQDDTVAVSEARPHTRTEAALKRALAATLGSHAVGSSSSGAGAEADAYGKGNPTDRLQFGYSPAITDEAVAFHARIPAEDWLVQRRANGRTTFVKHQKLPRANCEPVLSLLKLKQHWAKVSQFHSGLRGDHITSQDADQLLEMLAAKQRVDE